MVYGIIILAFLLMILIGVPIAFVLVLIIRKRSGGFFNRSINLGIPPSCSQGGTNEFIKVLFAK